MRCPICDSTDKWEDVDEISRHDKVGMHICNGCGFVSYPSLYKTEDEIKEYYRNDYRPAPNVNNLYSGQRKLNYHEFFLRDSLEKWIKSKKKIVVGEVGAAYGLFLKWIRDVLPNNEVHGSEMTLTYRRVAWHENKIELEEELDVKNRKYDLIVSYKVEEHLMDPDKKLREKVLALKEDGLVYISVPCWFDCMYLFGMGGFDLKNYYHTNHINTWSRTLFETMLRKCGLEIVKEDHCIYDSTYLCKRNDELMEEKPVYENPEDIRDRMKRIKKASMLFDDRKYKEAINTWPNYPNAWQAVYENNRATLHKDGYAGIKKDFILPMLKACPHSAQVRGIAGDLAMRYSQWDEAMGYFKKVLEMRPQAPEALINMSHVLRNMSLQDPTRKVELLKESRDLMKYTQSVSLQNMAECVNWSYKDASQIPMPNETMGG